MLWTWWILLCVAEGSLMMFCLAIFGLKICKQRIHDPEWLEVTGLETRDIPKLLEDLQADSPLWLTQCWIAHFETLRSLGYHAQLLNNVLQHVGQMMLSLVAVFLWFGGSIDVFWTPTGLEKLPKWVKQLDPETNNISRMAYHYISFQTDVSIQVSP